jgi:hypothetical protein
LRIENGSRVGGTARTAGRSSSSMPFHVDDAPAAARPAAAAALAPAHEIGALLALQAVEDPTLGRRRQVRRGKALLDTLDEMQADLLLGRISPEKLDLLMVLVGEARERCGSGLDALLDDIELRARVELAKRGRFPAL